jgi:flagellar basal body-associated protein FliL
VKGFVMKKRLKLIIPIVIVIMIATIATILATRGNNEHDKDVTSDISNETISEATKDVTANIDVEAVSDTFSVKKYIDVDEDKSKNECNDTTVYFDTIFLYVLQIQNLFLALQKY